MNTTDRAAMLDFLTEQRRHHLAIAAACERYIHTLKNGGTVPAVAIKQELCYTNISAPQSGAVTISAPQTK